MKKDRFEHLCREVEAGRDAFLRHSASQEEGMILGCDLREGNVVVRTQENRARNWSFSECEDIQRPKMGPMT